MRQREKKVIIHYYKFAGDYDGVGVWTWGNGNGGSENGLPSLGKDDKGWATIELTVDKASMGDEGAFIPFAFGFEGVSIGSFPTFGNAAKDSLNGNNITYDRTVFKASSDKVLDVYFVQGQDKAHFTRDAAMLNANLAVEDSENAGQVDPNFVVLTIIYYDATQEYEGWNIWTFNNGTNGSLEGVDFQYTVKYLNNGITGNHKVAFIKINKDAKDALHKDSGLTGVTGFILRTDSWVKKFPIDIFFPNTDVINNGGGVAYYIAGEGTLRTGELEDYLEDAYAFNANSVEAVSQTQIQLEMNKEIVTVKVDEAGVKTVVFDKTWITLTDKDGNAVVIEDVLYNSVVESTKSFSIVLAESSKLNPAKAPYTVSFAYESQTADKVVAYDTVAPTFTLLVDKAQRVEVGSTWALGLYTATDDVDGILTPFVSATGIVDTSKLGNYTVTLSVKDSLGNVGTEVLTVTVYDPCDEETASASLWLGFISAPLAVAAIFARRYFI